MAATDKTLRDQRTLDIVFAVSNILLLLSVVWMMWQDYAREYKTEQRAFREVEVAVSNQMALELLPTEAEFTAAETKVKEAKKKREEGQSKANDARIEMGRLQPKKEAAETKFQAVKADIDSINSFLNIALEHKDEKLAAKYRAQLDDLNKRLDTIQAERDDIVNKMKLEQLKVEEVEGPYTTAAAEFKKINDRFDTQVRLAKLKRWGWGDWLRTMPVINGFADPLKIHQFTIKDVTIDYNFVQAVRYDRCMSCHVGIDRPTYTTERLQSLTKEDANKERMKDAEAFYKRRVDSLEPKDAAGVPNPGELRLSPLSKNVLTDARVKEFAAHPRLDLYVGANSKHPAEKFGCSACHYGQGSGTSFLDSSHSPNDSKTREDWHKSKHWEPNHMWDFPMLPTRFIEASCIKCHHEVTDLVSSDNRVEAPKVFKGYNLIRENGCFGCHEISGWKSGARIGPDLRVEPTPPLEDMHPIERDRAIKDTDNRPGNLRKVGPALSRVSEKVTQDWIEKWLYSPSGFRPDTKMPHYYNLSTNKVDVLPDDQKTMPNSEIASIAHFLTKTSKDYLQKAEKQRQADTQKANAAHDDMDRLSVLLTKERLDKDVLAEMTQIKERIRLRRETKLVDLAPKHKGDETKGKELFIERGCLSCHSHKGTEPTIKSDAMFGPTLSQIPAKLGKSASARTWLIQWILNPQAHSPRSRMPQTHLTPDEAADVAAWLLNQKADDLGDEWDTIKVDAPKMDELKNLARVYLVRQLSKSDIDLFFKGPADVAKPSDDPAVKVMLADVGDDEKKLYAGGVSEDTLKFYLGKKAVNRLGCYGCHDIPGFEAIKPIGVALNDWGKKPADRLAFEDIGNFYQKHYYGVDSLVDKDGKPAHGLKDGKEPYEKFFELSLLGHSADRIGYLNQKVRDPRSYDFNRVRTWDDRARMPKFTFARPRQGKDEGKEDFQKRIYVDEAKARESVATFVLGLTAEKVPEVSVNHPKGDREAEVKGRQVLDKYNCNGCHVIRPGAFDFNVSDKTLEALMRAHTNQMQQVNKVGEIIFPNHIAWAGRNSPTAERLTSFAMNPRLTERDEEKYIEFNPSEALRFKDKNGKVLDIPAYTRFLVKPEDFPGGAALQTQADVDRYFASTTQYGGTFADLMVPYLGRKDPKRFLIDPFGDSGDARASLPPVLIGQGERTQPDWLYRFLLDPHQVRKMSILRMPKFNMSSDEARVLANYFAGVTRQTNTGIGLVNPLIAIPQQDTLDSDYWKKKNAEYVAHLKRTDALDMEGKPVLDAGGKPMKAFDQRLAAYTPIWEKMKTEEEKRLNETLKKTEEQTKGREKTIKDLEAKNKKKQDADTEKEIDLLKSLNKDAEAEAAKVQGILKALDVETFQKNWIDKEAYAADSYRLLTSRKACAQCHQVGSVPPSEKEKQGPPLALANQRLRPEWIVHWVDKPQRFVPYASMMPPNFSKSELKFQNLHAGVALEQMHAVRDVLMNFPRVSEMPINRLYDPDAPVEKK